MKNILEKIINPDSNNIEIHNSAFFSRYNTFNDTLLSQIQGIKNIYLDIINSLSKKENINNDLLNSLRKQLETLNEDAFGSFKKFNVESLRDTYNLSLNEITTDSELRNFYLVTILDLLQDEVDENIFIIETANKFLENYIPEKYYPEMFSESNKRIKLFNEVDKSISNLVSKLPMEQKDTEFLNSLGKLLNKAMPNFDAMTEFAGEVYNDGFKSERANELFKRIENNHNLFLEELDAEKIKNNGKHIDVAFELENSVYNSFKENV